MLFGHQNNSVQPVDADAIVPSTPPQDTPIVTTEDPATSTNPLAVDSATGVSLPVAPITAVNPTTIEPEEPSVLNQPATETAPLVTPPASPEAPSFPPDLPTAAEPVADIVPDVDTVNTEPEPADPPAMPLADADVPEVSPSDRPTAPSDSNELLDLKQQAIAQLSPIVGKLEQTPEEKFRTTMMMIQSTDNQSLIKEAYEAAQGITDEKVKAQALLDVVNEINYFTQQKPVA